MAKKQTAKPSTRKPEPRFVTATRRFKHNGRRIVPGKDYAVTDPIVACFPDFFTPVPAPAGDED